jgi:hypothetical protein
MAFVLCAAMATQAWIDLRNLRRLAQTDGAFSP